MKVSEYGHEECHSCVCCVAGKKSVPYCEEVRTPCEQVKCCPEGCFDTRGCSKHNA